MTSSLTVAAVVVILLTLCLVEALKLKSSGGNTVGIITRGQLQSRKTNTFLANSYLDTLDKPNNKPNNKGSSGSPKDYKIGGSNKNKLGPPSRKQRRETHQSDSDETISRRVSVYSVGQSIDLNALRAHVFRRGFGGVELEPEQSPPLALARQTDMTDNDVLHISNLPLLKSAMSRSGGAGGAGEGTDLETEDNIFMSGQDVFYYEYGTVVFWGLSKLEETAAITELAPFIENPSAPDELQGSSDSMEYMLDRSASQTKPLRQDLMRLRSYKVEEKLVLSYVMSQSSKLSFFEMAVNECLERTRYLPKELAQEGAIKMSKKRLNTLIGELFVEQMEINLFSTILDTPDFLWEDEEYAPLYSYLRSYLEVDDRVALLNKRLAVIRELLDVLTGQVADSNSTRLEWIIIWLITAEIVMGIASSPLFVGKKLASSLLVPTAILLFKRFGVR